MERFVTQTSLTNITTIPQRSPKWDTLKGNLTPSNWASGAEKWGLKSRGWKIGAEKGGWKIGADDCGLTCWAALTGAPRSAAGRPEMEKEEEEVEVVVEVEEEEEDRHMEKNQHKRKWSLDFLGVRRSILRDICNREGFCQTSPPHSGRGGHIMKNTKLRNKP